MMLSVTLARIAESLKLDGAMCIDCLASKTNRDQADVMFALQTIPHRLRVHVDRACGKCGTTAAVVSLTDCARCQSTQPQSRS